jgi:hypothetical protein
MQHALKKGLLKNPSARFSNLWKDGRMKNSLNAKKHCKITLDLQTGIYYDSLKQACEARCLKYKNVFCHIKNPNNKYGLIYA